MMPQTILERITKLRAGLQALKTTQSTQNDSYQFYRYRTDNLNVETGYWRYTCEFVPYSKQLDQVICNFVVVDYNDPMRGVGVQSRVNGTNPLIFEIRFNGLGGYLEPIYIQCVSNCVGFLKLNSVKESQ